MIWRNTNFKKKATKTCFWRTHDLIWWTLICVGLFVCLCWYLCLFYDCINCWTLTVGLSRHKTLTYTHLSLCWKEETKIWKNLLALVTRNKWIVLKIRSERTCPPVVTKNKWIVLKIRSERTCPPVVTKNKRIVLKIRSERTCLPVVTKNKWIVLERKNYDLKEPARQSSLGTNKSCWR